MDSFNNLDRDEKKERIDRQIRKYTFKITNTLNQLNNQSGGHNQTGGSYEDYNNYKKRKYESKIKNFLGDDAYYTYKTKKYEHKTQML